MRKVLIILFLVAVAVAIWLLVERHPGLFSKIYLWLIGFFGMLAWPLRKLWNWMNGREELQEIARHNQQLKQELQQLKAELAQARERLDTERRQNKRRIEALEHAIQQEDQQARAIYQELEALKKQTVEEFNGSLTPEDRRKMQDEIWRDVDFGL